MKKTFSKQMETSFLQAFFDTYSSVGKPLLAMILTNFSKAFIQPLKIGYVKTKSQGRFWSAFTPVKAT